MKCFLRIIILLFLSFYQFNIFAQIVINEVSNKNSDGFFGGNEDWIELYNSGSQVVNLEGYSLCDGDDLDDCWHFTTKFIQPGQFVSVLASGFSNSPNVNHYETFISLGELWRYQVADATSTSDWMHLNFDDTAWSESKLSIGYGDADDSTVLAPPLYSLRIRKKFSVTDLSSLNSAMLNIDVDDGFVAYLNGVEVARSGLSGSPPAWNELSADHEATYYVGGSGMQLELDSALVFSVLQTGENILAIDIHNTSESSSDLTVFAELTFGVLSDDFVQTSYLSPYFSNSGPLGSGIFQADFKLDSHGEMVYLKNPDFTVLDSVFVGGFFSGESIGRYPDGGIPNKLFLLPTPNASNWSSMAYDRRALGPKFIENSGEYASNLQVHLSKMDTIPGKIRFTSNGDEPTIFSSIYFGGITVSTTSLLKAKFFPDSTSIAPSETVSSIYMLNEDLSLPIISITAKPDDLYGVNGIFDNYYTDWKKACEIAYYDTTGVLQFTSRASIKPDGGAGGSRANPQHSVTVEVGNPLFGAKDPIAYPIIPSKPYITEYYSLYLRNGSNYWNAYPHKDAYMTRVMQGTNVDAQGYTPVNVFVNGTYSGVYELREKVDEHYFKSNFNNHEDSVDLLAISYYYGPNLIRTVRGSDSSFFSMHSYVTQQNPYTANYYDRCDSLLSLSNFIDYIAAENWFGNSDWLYNNMKFARMQSVDNKWRFYLQDIELGLAGWCDQTFNGFDFLRYSNSPNPFSELQLALLENTNYRNHFINRFADLMNTRFKPNFFQPMAIEMENELRPDIYRSFNLWSTDPLGSINFFDNYGSQLLYQMSERNTYVRQQIQTEFNLSNQVTIQLAANPPGAGYIKISTIVPDSLPWSGVYFNGVPVQITAIANPGYSFKHWLPNGLITSSNSSLSSIELNVPSNRTFTAVFEGDLVEDAIVFSELNYHPDVSIDDGNWVELHNTSEVSVDLSGYKLKSNDFWDVYEFPIGTNIPAGGFLVVVEDSNRFKSAHPMLTNLVGSTQFGFENDWDSILLYNPIMQQVDAMMYTDSFPFPLCADGWGRTLEKLVLNSDNTPSNWFCGCIGGSPGEAYVNCNEPLLFSEVNYNSLSTSINAGDWVELYNSSDVSIDIGGYVFKDKQDSHLLEFSTRILEPGELVVLVRDELRFSQRYGDIPRLDSEFDFGLGQNEVLRLYDPYGRLVQSCMYDTIQTWFKQPALSDYTLERNLEATYAYWSPEDWFVGCEGGSPGRLFQPCPVLPDGNFLWLYPNPAVGDVAVVIDNSKNSSGSSIVQLIDTKGSIVLQEDLISKEKVVQLSWDISTYRSGLYFVRVIQEGRTDQLKLIHY